MITTKLLDFLPALYSLLKQSQRFYTPVNTNLALSSKQSEFYTPSPSLINSTSKTNNLIFEGIINSKQEIPHGVYHPSSEENQIRNESDTIYELGINNTLAGLGLILNL